MAPGTGFLLSTWGLEPSSHLLALAPAWLQPLDEVGVGWGLEE